MYAERDLRGDHDGVPVLPSTGHPSSLAELRPTQPVLQRLLRQSGVLARVGPPSWPQRRRLLDAAPGRHGHVRRRMLPASPAALPLSTVERRQRRNGEVQARLVERRQSGTR